MFLVILILTLLLSVVLIVMVLLQPSKGGGITGAFGGIGGTLGSTFGQRRTLQALGKGTTYTAIAIATLCILANIFFVPKRSSNTPGEQPVTTGETRSATPTNPPVNLQNQSTTPATGDQGTQAPADQAQEGTPSTTPEGSGQ